MVSANLVFSTCHKQNLGKKNTTEIECVIILKTVQQIDAHFYGEVPRVSLVGGALGLMYVLPKLSENRHVH
jgi:hypothetical protein